MIQNSGHASVIEHVSASMLFVTDRGVSHEIVRHRLASYSQESTRYVSSVDKKQFKLSTDEDCVEAYQRGLSMRRVSELSERTEWQIYKLLDLHDIQRRGLNSKGVWIDEDFFETINTVEKAYLLGMIQADGSVRADNWQLTVTQHQDYAWYLLRMFRSFIRDKVCFSPDKKCFGISLCSQRLINGLISKGIIPNKSFVAGAKEADLLWGSIPDELKPAFLRGLLDGDGSIRFYKQKNAGETDSCAIVWNGESHLLSHISDWLKVNFGYQAKVHSTESDRLHRLFITQPEIGEAVCKEMIRGAQLPYGHPAKMSRILERLGTSLPIATWGDPKFQIVKPTWYKNSIDADFWVWLQSMDQAEISYRALLESGNVPQQARAVLPNSLKTEIVMTANLREWIHFFTLRCATKAHPQMRDLALMGLQMFNHDLPVLFGKLAEQYLVKPDSALAKPQ